LLKLVKVNFTETLVGGMNLCLIFVRCNSLPSHFQVEMGFFQKIDSETYRLLPFPSQQTQATMPAPTFIKEEMMGNGFQVFAPNCQPLTPPVTQNSGQFTASFPDRPLTSEMSFKPTFQMTIPQPSPPPQVFNFSHSVFR